MAGSIYTYTKDADLSSGIGSIQTSQGVVSLGQSGLFLPAEFNAATARGCVLVAGPASSPAQGLNAPTLAVGSAGSPNGAYRYAFTFVTAAGETQIGPENSITLTNQQGNVSNIPLGNATSGVTARGIYRTAAGGAAGTEKLVAYVNDNSTTSFVDNVADGSLGHVAPASDTAGVLGGPSNNPTSQVNYAVLTGSPADDAFPLGAGTGKKMTTVPIGDLPATVAFVTSPQIAPLDLVGYDARQGQFPTFVKYSGNPIFVGLGQGGSPLTSSTWNPVATNSQQWPITRPYVIRVDEILTSPLGKFYMYFSTDHATDHGGIGLAYADNPLGPWTYYGQVHQNTTGGSSQTEWPSVIWDEDNACLSLYHHVVGLPSPVIGGQVVCLATSTDGIAWTTYTGVSANGAIIDIGISNGSNGNDFWSGGSGYPSVFRIAEKWYSYLFLATATYNRSGIAASNDGRHWVIDPRYLGDLTTLVQDASTSAPTTHFLALNNVVAWWGGRLWAITLNSSFVSGTTPNPDTFYAAPLTEDLRGFRAKPKQCVSSTLQGWETTFFKMGSVLAYKGSLYLYYRSGNPILFGGAGENFGVAVATPGSV